MELVNPGLAPGVQTKMGGGFFPKASKPDATYSRNLRYSEYLEERKDQPYGPVHVMSPISAAARTLRPSVSEVTPIDTIGLGALFQRRR